MRPIIAAVILCLASPGPRGPSRRYRRRLKALAGDCKLRDIRGVNLYQQCGADFLDIESPRPPDVPYAARPKLKVIGER